MKKIICIVISVLLVFSLSACVTEPVVKLAPHGLPLSYESAAELIEAVEWFHETPKTRMADSDKKDSDWFHIDRITKLYEYEHFPEGSTLVDENRLSPSITLGESMIGYNYRLNRSDVYDQDSLRFGVTHRYFGRSAFLESLTPDWTPFNDYEDVYYNSIIDKSTGEEVGRQYIFFYDNHDMFLYLPNAVFDELKEAGVDIFSAKVIYERNVNR